MNKENLRIQMKEVIKNIKDKDFQSETIYQNILKNVYFQKAKDILIYFGVEDEVSTTQIIQYCFDNGKNVYIPFLKEIKFAQIKSFNDLEQIGKYLQPKSTSPNSPQPSTLNPKLCIIPGLAFDKQNIRLGRGSGWYDKFLFHNPEIYKIGICFKEQLIDNIPVEEKDVKMDEIAIGVKR